MIPASTSVSNLLRVLRGTAVSCLCLSMALAQHQPQLSVPPRELGVANYFIEARLDPQQKMIHGEERVLWRNQTEHSTDELWFHLYLNAFKNDRSTFALEAGQRLWDVKGEIPGNFWGWIEIASLELDPSPDDAPNSILSKTFAQPDDGNPDDQTVLKVVLENPVPPGGEIGLKIRFQSKLPRGVARTGWSEDYYFAAQWFPKLGVFEQGRWNCHQYHVHTEYYSDFGSYGVQLTVPGDYTVGGTGQHGRRNNSDGTVTYGFEQDRVHDFAWVASPRLRVRSFKFVAGRLPNVSVRLLLLAEHEHLYDRYVRAIIAALEELGKRFGPYPYPQLTVVDPAYRSDTGGMEYPTFITGRAAQFLEPEESLALESTAVHEVAHQWWYGVVANNEFEEAWLDEGLASWSESVIMRAVYPEAQHVERFLGGIPLAFGSLRVPYQTINLPGVRRFGTLDRMTQPSWQTVDAGSYGANSYAKPEVTLWTLQALLGEERMQQLLARYFEQFAFRHPRTEDFMNVANAVSGQDLSSFFEETFFSSELVDYSIAEASSEESSPRKGRDGKELAEGADDAAPPLYRTEVVVRRLEGARLPVEVLLEFEDGMQIWETWDGRDRWKRFVYQRPSRLRRAAVDPNRKILLDVDPTNNSWLLEPQSAEISLATRKWSAKWLFWVQNLLESFAFLG